MGFVPDEIVPGARVAILAQNPGADEEREGRPMVGTTGQMMDREYLPLAGLTRGHDVHVMNVLKCRWQRGGVRTNDLPPAKVLQAAVAHCTQAHLRIPLEVEVVVAQGALAWRILNGPAPISSWRGFAIEYADRAQAFDQAAMVVEESRESPLTKAPLLRKASRPNSRGLSRTDTST